MCQTIRSRAPLRIGFAGGGTDLKEYSDINGGHVVNATISKYAFTEINISKKTGHHFFSAISLDSEKAVSFSSFEQLQNDSMCGKVAKELILPTQVHQFMCLSYPQIKSYKVSAKTYSDVPIGSGLGSSSTIVVALVKAYDECFSIGLDKIQIAETAYKIERELCGYAGGYQDQFSATFGGFNSISFSRHSNVVAPLDIKSWFRWELESSLILHSTSTTRDSSLIIKDQIISAKANTEEKSGSLHRIKSISWEMKKAILNSNFDRMCSCLNEAWHAKIASSSKITNNYISTLIDHSKEYGARAAKISGAGGGGFILFMANPSDAAILKKFLSSTGRPTFFCSFVKDGCQSWKA